MTNQHLANFKDVWNNGLLIFDTSSLLRIYEWQIDKAIEFKDVLRFKIDNIWIPHQVNKEFEEHVESVEAKNRHAEIIEKLESPSIKWNKIKKMLERWGIYSFEDEFKLKVLEMESLGVNPDKVRELKQIGNILHREHRRVVPINSLFKELFSMVGEPFQNEQEIIKEFEALSSPPGYKDKKKHNENSHGDFFIWKQMQSESIRSNRNIIFITEDIKEDWFNIEMQIPREDLLKEFYETTNNKIIIISLSSFLEECSVYLNEDIQELVAYSSIQDEIIGIFDEWYPEQLLDKLNDYLEEDAIIKYEMENMLEVCIDTVSFEGVTNQNFNLDDHEIIGDDESQIVFHSYVDILVDFDANAHMAREDFKLGTASIELRVWINITVEKEWQSEDSNRVAFRREAESIEIVDIEFLEATSKFEREHMDVYEYEQDLDDYEDDPDPDPDEYNSIDPDDFVDIQNLSDDEIILKLKKLKKNC